ncbi:phage baseplate protein, partial [Salmonella enterica subsp. enterica serovar Enteritidis]|nr:phage baseplate protein [Salmonella enterica subsp. enterica serovar Enteritidis]
REITTARVRKSSEAVASLRIPSTGYADTLTGGADTEEPETWRARVMERYYWIPQGGADPDYVIWAKEIAGITRAWT